MKKESSVSHTMKTKSVGAGAIFMKRRALEPELCHFYYSSATLVTDNLNTLRAGVRYIRTLISAKNQQLSVALPMP